MSQETQHCRWIDCPSTPGTQGRTRQVSQYRRWQDVTQIFFNTLTYFPSQNRKCPPWQRLVRHRNLRYGRHPRGRPGRVEVTEGRKLVQWSFSAWAATTKEAKDRECCPHSCSAQGSAGSPQGIDERTGASAWCHSSSDLSADAAIHCLSRLCSSRPSTLAYWTPTGIPPAATTATGSDTIPSSSCSPQCSQVQNRLHRHSVESRREACHF